MQDMTVTAAVWIPPEFAQSDRYVPADASWSATEEDALAHFEAMLPFAQGERADGAGPDSVGSGGGTGAVGMGGMSGPESASATPQGEPGGRRPGESRVPQPDAIVSTYTIHHARLGVVHVQQTTGGGGAVGTLALRTDDDALRARLRDAMPALRCALADDAGRGPSLSVDA